MAKIDAHQHFWIFDPVRDNWINEEMLTLKQDFLPAQLLPVLQQNGMDGCVAIQASQTDDETMFLLELAAENSFIKGVVGWVDLKADNLEEKLREYRMYNHLKGFRHVLQSEPDKQYMLQPAFQKGIAALQRQGYTYDILIYPEHLPMQQNWLVVSPIRNLWLIIWPSRTSRPRKLKIGKPTSNY